MAPHVVILDLDGTLLDTRRRHHAIYAELVRELGAAPLPLDRFWAAKRRAMSWERLLALTFGRKTDVGDFVGRFAARIEEPKMLALDQPQPGARRALARLRQAGLEAVVITRRRDARAMADQLGALSLTSQLTEAIAASGGVKHDAAAPYQGRIAAWIGDTEEDLDAARALGVAVGLVTNGIRSRAFLSRLHPDWLAAGIGAAVTLALAGSSVGPPKGSASP